MADVIDLNRADDEEQFQGAVDKMMAVSSSAKVCQVHLQNMARHAKDLADWQREVIRGLGIRWSSKLIAPVLLDRDR